MNKTELKLRKIIKKTVHGLVTEQFNSNCYCPHPRGWGNVCYISCMHQNDPQLSADPSCKYQFKFQYCNLPIAPGCAQLNSGYETMDELNGPSGKMTQFCNGNGGFVPNTYPAFIPEAGLTIDHCDQNCPDVHPAWDPNGPFNVNIYASTGPPNIGIGASTPGVPSNDAQSNMQAGINLYGADPFLQPGTGGNIPQRTPDSNINKQLKKIVREIIEKLINEGEERGCPENCGNCKRVEEGCHSLGGRCEDCETDVSNCQACIAGGKKIPLNNIGSSRADNRER
jgi:hypothetical protein